MRIKRRTATLLFAILVLSGIQSHSQCTLSPNQIQGKVFLDASFDGIYQQGETPVEAVQIRIYDNLNQLVTTATSSTDGRYSLNGLTDGNIYRIEWAFTSDYNIAANGLQFQSDVQFIQSPACDINLGLVTKEMSIPSANTPLVMAQFVKGPELENMDHSTLVQVPQNFNKISNITDLVQKSDLGAIWSLEWKRTTRQMFSVPFIKQSASLKDNAHDVIYVSDMSDPEQIQSRVLARLPDLGVVVQPLIVTDPMDCEYGAQVGKYGLGGLALSADESRLYVANLYNNSIVSLSSTNPTKSTTYEISVPDPGCDGGDYRIFALELHQNKLFVGVTCIADQSKDARDMQFHVYEMDLNSHIFNNVFSTDYPYEYWYDSPSNGEKFQQWLTDIEFTKENNMILGVTDRMAHRYCTLSKIRFRQQHPDILMVWNNNGTWTLENNGTAGPLKGSGIGNYQGPGGGEFFGDDYWIIGPYYHTDIATGSIAISPDKDEVIAATFDPSTSSFTGGIHAYSTQNGELQRLLEVYPNEAHFFGKASGLGDLEFLLPDQPIEIGNYAWMDENGNGIQDPGEAAIGALSLDLYDENCQKIGATKTNNLGLYVFDANNVDVDGNGEMDGLEHNTTYSIVIGTDSYDPVEGVFVLGGEKYHLTTANMTRDNTDSDAEMMTSNCADMDNRPQIVVQTGGLGKTNYSFDMGFVPVAVPPPVDTPKVFDLALRKTVSSVPFKANDIAEFTIEVFNQGELTAGSVDVIDYLPKGYVFEPVLNPGWIKAGDNVLFTINENIAPGQSKSISLKVILSSEANPGNIINISEIAGAKDINGRSMSDVDSKYDQDPTNDTGGLVNSPTDDIIDNDGVLDEDDQDPATIALVDLALIKTTLQTTPVKIGQDVRFEFQVINQGNVTVKDVVVLDYIPEGYILNPNDQNLWTAHNNFIQHTIKEEIEPLGTATFYLDVTISENATIDNLINYGEIIAMSDPYGNDISSKDFDSSPDDNPNNDIGGNPYNFTDNKIDDDGTVDEDDHDPAMVPVFDLALRKSDGNLISNIATQSRVKFAITVFNQGNIAAKNIEISEYVPLGFEYNSNDNIFNWIKENDRTYKLILNELLAPGQRTEVEIVLDFLEEFKAETLTNRAEISNYTDELDRRVVDFDSNADADRNNDLEVDDEILDHGALDEDDADFGVTGAKWFDLALRKYTPKNIVNRGDTVPFYIDIINQGKIEANNILIVDYIPRGLRFLNGYGWEKHKGLDKVYAKVLNKQNGLIPPEGLLPDSMITVRIDLIVLDDADAGTIINVAEIGDATDMNGNPEQDIDSTPDDDPTNDPGGQAGITDNAVTLDASVDEDDSDPAFVYLSEITTDPVCMNNATAINNGQFQEDITILGPPGHNWFIVSADNIYKYPSANPPAVPTPFTTGPLGDVPLEIPSNQFSSFYVISGISLDDTPFSITFENQYGDRHYLNVNGRSYDRPSIFGLDNVCKSALTTYYTDLHAFSTYEWSLSGGGVIVGSNNQAEVDIQWNETIGGPYTLTLMERNRNSCLEPNIMQINIGNQRAEIVHCISFSQMSIDENGELIVKADMLLKGEGYDYNSFAVMLLDAYDQPIPANTLTCDYIGQMVTAKVINTCTGNSCWAKIAVEDKLPPIIDCIPDTMNCIKFRKYNGPLVSDNCDDQPELILLDERIEKLCDPLFLKKVTRTYIAKDASGNVSEACEQELYLTRFKFDNVIEPLDRKVNTANALMCGAYKVDATGNPDPVATGVPMVNGQTMYPTVNGYCNVQLGYFDVNLPRVGCVQKVIRTWYLFEWWCGNEYLRRVMIQEIEIVDIVPPVITCPDDDAFTTNGLSCESTVWVPAPVVTDNCSDSIYVDVVYPGGFIKNFKGGYLRLPVGENTIKFKAYDQCYNVDSCEYKVIIEDKTSPVVICDFHTVVSLDKYGEVWIPATIFDDGSYDDCQIGTMKARRMDLGDACNMTADTFADEVGFCCEDIGEPVMIQFRVTDESGNVNMCMVEVEVQDKLHPTFSSVPADTTINCHYNYDLTDLSEFGQPTVDDNCGFNYEERVFSNITQCRVGYIDRVFVVSDSFSVVSRTQRIRIVNENPFEFKDITWPLDYTTSTCDSLELIPENLPASYDRPGINEDECDLVGVTYKDEIYPILQNTIACYKILRTWSVINWCNQSNTPGSTQGPSQGSFDRWTYEQVIKVVNTVAPEITSSCAPLSTCTYDPDCNGGFIDLVATATDDCTPSNELRWEYHIDLDKDGVYDIIKIGQGGTAVATDSFKLGQHKILWVFEDKCGNKTVCEQEFEIINCKAPIAYCKNGIVVALNPMDLDNDGQCDIEMVTVWASDLDAGSYHTCGYPITYSIGQDTSVKSITFDCGNKGINVVTMCVTDVNGNKACCELNVIVQDNNNEDCCPNDFDLPCVIFPNDSLIYDCTASLDTAIFGTPITSNCNVDQSIVTFVDSLDSDSDHFVCNKTKRKWTVQLFLGNKDTTVRHNQFITLDNQFTEDSIIWPLDTIDLIGCNPSVDTGVIGGIPVLLGEYCDFVEMAYVDTDVSDPNDVCTEVVRMWSVTNHCENDQTFTFRQIIILRNQGDPILTGPADITVNNDINLCDARVELIAVQSTDCSSGVVIVNDYNNGGADASDVYPVGVTTVKYTATDACGNSSMFFVNVTVEDDMIPNVSCPANVTINCDDDISHLNNYGVLTATDNCALDRVEMDSIYNINVCNVGSITRRITAFDTSGNMATCEQIITIENPGAITIDDITCPNDTVNLTGCQSSSPDSTGRPVVDTSGARCSMITITYVDSMYTDTCNGSPCNIIERTWTIVDSCQYDGVNGIFTCFQLIIIDGGPLLVITCPPDTTINCGTPVGDLTQYGDVTVQSQCGVDSIRRDSTSDLNICGVGTITRTFTVVDSMGNSMSCDQIITIIIDNPITESDITWPLDTVTLDTCTSTDPDSTGRPVIDTTQASCYLLSTNYTDSTSSSSRYCLIIMREWTVIDSCQLDSLTGTGIFTFNQLINVIDTVPPIITPDFTDTLIQLHPDSCEARVNIGATAIDCTNTILTNNSPVGGGGDNADGVYPIGITNFSFYAEDECGNVDSAQVSIEIADTVPPTIICHKIIIVMPDTGEILVMTEDFITSLSDNCTDSADIMVSFDLNDFTDTMRVYNCDSLGGDLKKVFITEMYAKDQYGNIDSCVGQIEIHDTNGVCDSTSNLKGITGNIYFDYDIPMPEVEVLLEGSGKRDVTDGEGKFAFRGLPIGERYVVSPIDMGDYLNGVSTKDILKIQKHILGKKALVSPYHLIAADINDSKAITTGDIAELRKLILGKVNAYKKSPSWKYIQRKYVFPDPLDPFIGILPETYQVTNLTKNKYVDFIGIKMGDVSGDARVNGMQEVDAREGMPEAVLNASIVSLSKDKYMMRLSMDQAFILEGLQFTLQFDPSLINAFSINPNKSMQVTEEHIGLSYLHRGLITFSWNQPDGWRYDVNDDVFFFELGFELIQKGVDLTSLFDISSMPTRAEAYINDVDYSLTLKYKEQTTVNQEVILYQNHPNPFEQSTVIKFRLPNDDDILLTVLDVNGKTVYRVRGRYKAGLNQVVIDRNSLAGTGIYYYRLDTKKTNNIKKMILMD